MIILPLVQGTPEWVKTRLDYRSASKAAAMLGISPYKTRDELLREKATGLVPEVDAVTQQRFDQGHRVEAFSRSIAEKNSVKSYTPVSAYWKAPSYLPVSTVRPWREPPCGNAKP